MCEKVSHGEHSFETKKINSRVLSALFNSRQTKYNYALVPLDFMECTHKHQNVVFSGQFWWEYLAASW